MLNQSIVSQWVNAQYQEVHISNHTIFLRELTRLYQADVYIPGCPPRPEALIDGFGLLREKIIRIGGAPSSGRDARSQLS